MSCRCTYTEIPSGVIVLNGAGAVDANFRNPDDGLTVGGSAAVSTDTVWDSFDSVFHLDETGNGTVDEYVNSVGARHGQGGRGKGATYVRANITGINFKAQSFDGNDYVALTHDAMGFADPFTVSLWALIEGEYIERVLYTRGYTQSDATPAEGWCVQLGYNGDNNPYCRVQLVGSDDWNTYQADGTTTLSDCWHHLAAVWQPGDKLTLYVDGTADGTASTDETAFVPSTSHSYCGRHDIGRYHIGQAQELRVSPVARSAAWLTAEHDNYCNSNFYSVAEYEDGAAYD